VTFSREGRPSIGFRPRKRPRLESSPAAGLVWEAGIPRWLPVSPSIEQEHDTVSQGPCEAETKRQCRALSAKLAHKESSEF
jgi:hypothetical protein